MKGKDLLEGLGKIDDALVEEAVSSKKMKEVRWRRVQTMAAGLLVVAVLSSALIPYIRKTKSPEEVTDRKASYMVGLGTKNPGDFYQVSEGYEKIYDKLNSQEKKDYFFNLLDEEGVSSLKSAPAESAAENGEQFTYEETYKDGSSDYSKTNVMTEGVDESDIVKCDGDYLYRVKSGSVEIFDITGGVPEKAAVVRPTFQAPSDMICELYVDGDKMLIITEHFEFGETEGFWGGNQGEKVETMTYSYDISHPEKPKESGMVRQDGSYQTSRKVGDEVYVFTNYNLELPDLKKDEALTPDNLAKWLPSVNGKVAAPDCIWLPKEEVWAGLFISSFNVNQPEKVIDAKYVAKNYAEIYVSAGAIYIYETDYAGDREILKLSKLKIEKGKIDGAGSTSLNGSIRDSFAINEYRDCLRIVTTSQNYGGEVNILYVLDDQLKELGRIEDIAVGESLYSARFMGDTGYFVTYRNMDPLFTVDLSDPRNPRIVGELKIPGFSDYLHFWGKDRLLGMGEEWSEEGNFIGMKLSMFNISDPANVYEENQLVMTEETDCPAFQGEYKGILADEEKNLIGFAADNYEADEERKNYYILAYDPETGFNEKMRCPIDGDSLSYRGVYSGDYFYVVGYDRIVTYNMREGFIQL